MPAGSFTPHGRQSQVSITTGCMRGVCVREGGGKGVWGQAGDEGQKDLFRSASEGRGGRGGVERFSYQ